MLLALVSVAQLGKIVTFLAMLSILVVLHELGHFVLARRNGVRVNEFSVGFGPKILSWKSPRTGTIYSLRVLPLGGYCAMHGEDGKTSEAEQQREFRDASGRDSESFQAKSPWSRLAIILAGPLSNFVLAYLILLVSALAFGVMSETKNQPFIGPTLTGSPASVAGLQTGDRVLSIDGVAIANGAQLVSKIHGSLGKQLDLAYQRGDVRGEVYVTPKACPQNAHWGCIGFNPIPAFVSVSVADAFRESGNEFVNVADQTFGSIALLVTHFGTYAGQVRGAVGLGQAAMTVQDFGWGAYFQLAAVISFALGLFNLLPLPALDGGRAAFIVAELIRGKPIDPEKEAMVHFAGFAALIALMLIVTFHDVARIVGGGGVLN